MSADEYACALSYFGSHQLLVRDARRFVRQLSFPLDLASRFLSFTHLCWPEMAQRNWVVFDRTMHEGIGGCIQIVNHRANLVHENLRWKKPGWQSIIAQVVDLSEGQLTLEKATAIGREHAVSNLNVEIHAMREEIFQKDNEANQANLADDNSVNQVLYEVSTIRDLAINFVCDTALEILDAFEDHPDWKTVSTAHCAWAEGYRAKRYDDLFRAHKMHEYLASSNAPSVA